MEDRELCFLGRARGNCRTCPVQRGQFDSEHPCTRSFLSFSLTRAAWHCWPLRAYVYWPKRTAPHPGASFESSSDRCIGYVKLYGAIHRTAAYVRASKKHCTFACFSAQAEILPLASARGYATAALDVTYLHFSARDSKLIIHSIAIRVYSISCATNFLTKFSTLTRSGGVKFFERYRCS